MSFFRYGITSVSDDVSGIANNNNLAIQEGNNDMKIQRRVDISESPTSNLPQPWTPPSTQQSNRIKRVNQYGDPIMEDE